MVFNDFDRALEEPLVVKRLHLIKQKGIKKLLQQIGQFENLEELKIDSCTMSKVPLEIFELKKLKSLSISNCGHRLKAYPEELGQLQSLEVLHFGKQWMDTLPDSIGQLSNLKVLSSSDFHLRWLPESLAQLQQLRVLDLPKLRLDTLPTFIKALVNLEKLSLGVRLRAATRPFPDDFFGGFKQLKSLALVDCDMNYAPTSIGQLTQLTHLDLSENALIQFPIELLQLRQLGDKFYIRGNKSTPYGATANLSQSNSVKLTVEKYNIDTTEAACYFGCLGKYRVDSMNSSTLLGALTQPELLDVIRIQALDYAASNYSQNAARHLAKGSQIAILGTHKFSKEDATILKNAGIQVLGQITDAIPETCTHLLIGKNCPTDKRLEAGTCHLIAPQNLVEWLNTNKDLYLLDEQDEASPQMQQNVLELLTSAEDENIEIALAAMKTGGVPKEAISTLFILAKTDSNAAIKRKAKKLVQPLLSTRASENFKIRGSFKSTASIPKLIDKLTDQIEREINKDHLYRYAYLRFGQGQDLLPYLLNAQDPLIRQLAWQDICEGDRLSIYETWGLPSGKTAEEDLPSLQHIEQITFLGERAETFGILHQLKNVHTVRLLRTKYTTWTTYDIDRVLLPFKQLKCLEISLKDNYRSLHTVFNLKQLEELQLSEMPIYYRNEPQLEELPIEIGQLKNLKRLHINHKYANIKNLEILAQLSQLEYLNLANCPIEALPKAFQQLQQLQTLDIRGTQIKSIPEDLIAALPNCTILH